MESRKNKAELVAEIKALRIRIEELELSGNPQPLTQPALPGKVPPGEREDWLQKKNIIAAIPHGIVQIDLDGTILYANPAYHEMFEYDDGELIGTSVIDRVEIDEKRQSLIDFIAMLRKDQPTPTPYFQTRFTKTGRKINTQVDFHYDRDTEGKLVSFTYAATDITERKRAEEALRESEERLSLVLDASNVGVWDWNIRTGEVLFSTNMKNSLGYAEENVPSRLSFWENLVHPDDMPELRNRLREHFKGETATFKYECRIRLKDGKYQLNLDIGKVIEWDADGKSLRMVGVNIDISDRRNTEVALQESKALLASYIATAPVGMAIFDSELRYTNINEALADINGISIENHIHKRPRDILPKQLGLDVEKRFRDILRTSQPIIHEEISGETLSQPGVTRHWLHSFFPILGAEQKPNGIGVTVVEITKIKKTEEQLRQSQKMEALGTLSGGIAHDFNNMLYPIFIYANLLMKKFEPDSEEYTDLKEINNAAERAKDLVTQILMFSRRSEGVKQVCDLVSVVKEAMTLMRAAIPANVTIDINLTQDIIPVYCDSSQLYQVAVNVCTNAGQAIAGGGKVKVALEALDVAGTVCFGNMEIHGKYCRLTVSDSGIGMDDETQAKIFDPFFTTRDVGQGTGLGLSTVFGIVHDHEGGIKVSSETGKGTTFEIFLPLAEGPVEELPEIGESTDDYSGTENILFVDDEKSIRNLGRDCLGRIGYIVTTVADGQQAMEIFAENPDQFDLVVTDQTMPNMTGEALANALLKLRPDIPIIICTGDSQTITPESRKALKVSTFLQKPLAPTQLVQVVREVLDQVNTRYEETTDSENLRP